MRPNPKRWASYKLKKDLQAVRIEWIEAVHGMNIVRNGKFTIRYRAEQLQDSSDSDINVLAPCEVSVPEEAFSGHPLTVGDYLIAENDGRFSVMGGGEFEELFMR